MANETIRALIRNKLGDLDEPIEKLILQSMNEGVIILECNGEIHTVNRSAARILDRHENELIGKTFGQVFSDEQENGHFMSILSGVFDHSAHTAHAETQFKRRDGQTVDLAVATSSLFVDECRPGLESVVLVFRDVTAFKSLERVRKRAVDHLSHEMKTPLAIIEASLSGLFKHPQNESAHEKTIQRIRRNLKRLRDIQQVVELILNPPPYRPERVAIIPETEKILEKLSVESAHRAVRLKLAPSDVEAAMVDTEILAIVLPTLIKNAVENTPDGGEISVSLEEHPAGLRVTVADGGVGIALRDQEFLFDGFHHTQETDEYSTKRPYDFNAGGKGLELMRLKALSEAGYFDISFESRRCHYMPAAMDHCPGSIADCPHITDTSGCRESGGTSFHVTFQKVARG